MQVHKSYIGLSMTDRDSVPPNLEFQIDDLEDQWTFHPALMDYIHVRYMASAVRNWPKLLGQAKKYASEQHGSVVYH